MEEQAVSEESYIFEDFLECPAFGESSGAPIAVLEKTLEVLAPGIGTEVAMGTEASVTNPVAPSMAFNPVGLSEQVSGFLIQKVPYPSLLSSALGCCTF